MIDFPTNPTVGQVFNSGVGPIYTWDGIAWSLPPVNVKTADRRNRVVNPVMQVSQENGSSVVSTVGAYPVDQWMITSSGLTMQAAQAAIVSPARAKNTLVQSYGVAKASLAATDYGQIYQPLEGQRVQDFAWGTPAKAIPAVLRFSAYADIAGTYTASVTDPAGNVSFLYPFTLDAVGVWKTFNIPIPAPISGGTWATDGSAGMLLHFCTACGTTYQGVQGWQTGNKVGLASQANLASVINKNLAIADVGLYADPDNTGIAPPFEVTEYGNDLRDCKRYFFNINSCLIFTSYASAGGLVITTHQFEPMRTTPTAGYTSVSYANATALATNAVTDRLIRPQVTATAAGQAYGGCNILLNARM
jgi:rubredoxin